MRAKQTNYGIYKRKDGRFEGRIKLRQNDSEEVSYCYVYARSELECALKMEQIYVGLGQGSLFKGELRQHIKYEDICLRWLNHIRGSLKESTAANYMYIQKQYLLPHFGSCMLSAITETMVNKFIAKLTEAKKLAASTVANIIVIFKMTLLFGECRLNLPNPLRYFRLVRPRQMAKARRISDSDWQRLKILVRNDSSVTAAAIYLAVSTGMRLGEICALRRSDLDFDNEVLLVRHTVQRVRTVQAKFKTKLVLSPPKSLCSCRVIPLPQSLLKRLHRLCCDLAADDFLFGTDKKLPLEPRTMQYRFKQYLKFHNIAPANFHQLRHKFAGSCIEQNFDLKSLSEILGHSSVSITLNYYVHPTLDFKRRQLEKVSGEK